MKYIISHNQYKLLIEQEEKVIEIPFEIFNNDWNILQKFLEKRNYPPYKIWGNLNLRYSDVTDLGNLVSVEGGLDLYNSKIESLGNLTSVGGYLDLRYSEIESLGNLTSVGGWLDLHRTPISKTMSKKEIRQIVSVEGDIYL